ncbi:MAG: family mycofactocin-dependent oxidoreductase [Frankiales bacterium]|nr:family mycofactocin-dependent oxidoreductase [Frankiales bacterium]MCW2584618.1 family mycofactocin-dependent oxidoreductase [Frankiales bacterium]
MHQRYLGKTALITGAARGQGRAHAVRLAQEGADVLLVDICETFATTGYDGPTVAELEDTVALVEKEGRRALSYVVDTRDYAALKAAVDDGVAQLGGLDVVVANAGICTGSRFVDISLEQWQETIGTNLTGTFHTLKATVPVLIAQGRGGAIVITSSVAGLRGLPFLADYSASKHALVGLARSVANEVGQHLIRVNTIHPASVPTGMTTPGLFPLVVEDQHTLGPIFMNGLPATHSDPEDIAAAVAWLCSDEARHVTGAAIPLDIGTLMR